MWLSNAYCFSTSFQKVWHHNSLCPYNEVTFYWKWMGLSVKTRRKESIKRREKHGPRVSCSLNLLPKGGATIGTRPLTHGEAAEDSNGEKEDGTEDPQTGEVFFQHSNSAGWASPHYHHWWLDNGVRSRIVWLLGNRRHLGVSLSVVRRGWRWVLWLSIRRYRSIILPEAITHGNGVIWRRHVLQKWLVIHRLSPWSRNVRLCVAS